MLYISDFDIQISYIFLYIYVYMYKYMQIYYNIHKKKMDISPKIQLRDTLHMGKGFFAKQFIHKDQQLLKLHNEKIICCDSYSDIAQYANLKNSPNISSKMLFAYYLAIIFTTKQNNKQYKDILQYCKILPKQIDALVCWQDNQLSKIENKQLVENVKEKKKRIMKQYEQIKSEVKKQWDKPFSEYQYRIFEKKGEIELVGLDIVVYFYGVIQSRSIHYQCNQDNHSDVGALAPALQLFNHSPNPQCQVQGNHTFTVRTKKQINKDQQIFVSYGRYDEQKFLQTYGFLQNLVQPIPQNQNYRAKLAQQYNKIYKQKQNNKIFKNS